MKKITSIAFVVILILVVFFVYIYVSNNKNQVNQILNEKVMQDVSITVLKEGEGKAAENNQTVKVHYTGWLTDGTKFDSSLDRGEPFSFVLGAGQVIQGWDKGVLGMKEGEIRRLEIPAEMAYGDRDLGIIPANSELHFEVELIEVFSE